MFADATARSGALPRATVRQNARLLKPFSLQTIRKYSEARRKSILIKNGAEPIHKVLRSRKGPVRKKLLPRAEPRQVRDHQPLDLNRVEDEFDTQQLRNLAEELTYLKDPLVLAEDVQFKLNNGQLGEAVYLTRAASKHMSCTVSWNHLIKCQLESRRIRSSMKLYNDMKKRGQHPDAHTYTIILRGLADNTAYPIALEKALSIYHSLWGPNSRLRPSIIHSNAVLKVCARAGDLDSMWGIAGKLPRSGIQSADTFTYTTILNTIRRHALEPVSGEDSEEQQASRRDAAVLQGRKMWDDIVSRWWGGEIRMDEELACSMGRLLLIGSKPRDWDDILSLVEQTMGVPRLIPRLGSEARRDNHVPKSLPPPSMDRLKESDPIPDGPNTPGGEFNSQGPSHLVSSAPIRHVLARPSGNTLSLVLEACLQTRILGPAKEYWTLLTTTPYSVKPDGDNITRYLRLLRLTRSSAVVADLFDNKLPDDVHTAIKHCRIAMSACRRDSNNPNVMKHALQILKVMYKSVKDPDALTMSNYLETARATGRKEDIAEALLKLEPGLLRMRSVVILEPRPGTERTQATEDMWRLLREMVGGADKLLESKDDMSPEEREQLIYRRSQWQKWSLRYRTNPSTSTTYRSVMSDRANRKPRHEEYRGRQNRHHSV